MKKYLFKIVVAALVVFCLSLFGLFPWSRLNCSTIDIDLGSGRVRNTRYLFWVPVRRTVSDSALTEELLQTDLMASPCEWQPVLTQSPGTRHSPHYRYHGALGQIRELEIYWETAGVPKKCRRMAAIHLLHLWQDSGDSSGAQGFLSNLIEKHEWCGDPLR